MIPDGRPPRILHVIATLDAGGSEMWALRLLTHWHGAIEQGVVAIARASGVLEPQVRALAPLRTLSDEIAGKIGARALYRAIRQSAAAQRPDAVLIHSFGVHQLAAAVAARSLGIRGVAGSAGNPPPRDRVGRAKWAAVLAGSRLAGCPVAGCSHTVHAQLRALGVGMPAGSLAIPCGIAAPPATPRRRDRPIRQLGMVARLDGIKDHATLLRAFALVVAVAPDTRLSLIGDGPLRGTLEALARDLAIDDRVAFLGRRTDVADVLETLDLFVFSTTRDEGFGIVLIEAMAHDLPIVASDVPACREVLAGGDAGMLVAPGDADALAQGILRWIADPSDAADHAVRGRRRVEGDYAIATCAARWHDLLRLPSHAASAA